MKTIEKFVENYMNSNNLWGKISRLLIAENAPNFNTYFYRSWNNNSLVYNINTNPFLQNISKAIGINIMQGNPITNTPWTELDLLNEVVINKGFLVIDAYKNGMHKPAFSNRHNISDIDKDIKFIKPSKILFINISANTQTMKDLVNLDPLYYTNRIVPDYLNSRICYTFPNRPLQVQAFVNSINFLIINKLI